MTLAAYWSERNIRQLSRQLAGITDTVENVLTSLKVSEANKQSNSTFLKDSELQKICLSVLGATVTVSGDKQSPKTFRMENISGKYESFSCTEDDLLWR